MIFIKTPWHITITALILICLLGAAFWVYRTNRTAIPVRVYVLPESRLDGMPDAPVVNPQSAKPTPRVVPTLESSTGGADLETARTDLENDQSNDELVSAEVQELLRQADQLLGDIEDKIQAYESSKPEVEQLLAESAALRAEVQASLPDESAADAFTRYINRRIEEGATVEELINDPEVQRLSLLRYDTTEAENDE